MARQLPGGRGVGSVPVYVWITSAPSSASTPAHRGLAGARSGGQPGPGGRQARCTARLGPPQEGWRYRVSGEAVAAAAGGV